MYAMEHHSLFIDSSCVLLSIVWLHTDASNVFKHLISVSPLVSSGVHQVEGLKVKSENGCKIC